MERKSIVHVDLNAFFAQCEINKNPELKGKPIAIGGDHKRGIIATASYEARKYGVHSGMPTVTAKRNCPSLIIVPAHYHLYSAVSHSFMKYLKDRFPLLEQVSIDECYIDMTAFINNSNAHDFLLDLQLSIYHDLELKCSIGYAHTRFLAKMSSDFKKPLGLTCIYNDEYKELFWPLSIDKMWGVGKATQKKLTESGILTIGDLAKTYRPELEKVLGSAYPTYFAWANGQGNDVVEPVSDPRKSISKMETYINDVTDLDTLKDTARTMVKDMVSDLKDEHMKAKTVVITLRDPSFSTRSKRKGLGEYTDDEDKLLVNALNLLEDFYQEGEPIRLLGVGFDDCLDKDMAVRKDESYSLFDVSAPKEEEKEEKPSTASILNGLNRKKSDVAFTTLGMMEKKDKKA